jgi:hypothetical protein
MSNKPLQHIRTRSVEYAQYRMLRVLSGFSFLLFAGIILVSLYFLYTRTYRTIGQVEAITSLGPITQTIVLDIEGFGFIEGVREDHSALLFPVVLRDPFNVPKQELVTSTIVAGLQ